MKRTNAIASAVGDGAKASAVTESRGQQRLLLKTQEACEVLGGIHARTLARLEQRGLIRGVKLLRHKLYARADIEALVEEVRKWQS
jgi:hypothetical protein